MIYNELDEVGSHWLKTVSTSTGDIAGFVKWQEPKHGIEPSTDLPRWPVDADQELCTETFGTWAKQHRDLMGTRGHSYLEIVATAPAYQGKGAGSLMMRWALEKADEERVEAFLEASPDAVALYRKHGFDEAAKADTFIDNARVKGKWYTNLFMIRPARSKAGMSEE